MGVQGLWKLIEPSGRMVPLENMNNKVLAVDVSIWLHQAMKGMHDAHGAPVAIAHLLVLFHRLCKLLFYKIKPVFVFDGGVPSLKRQTMAVRRSKKSVARTEASRVRDKLLKNLLKHEALRHVLSDQAATAALGLTSLTLPGPGEEEDLYKLPPIASQASPSNSSASEQDTSDDEDVKPLVDIHTVDLESLKTLPPEVRHDILSEVKDTRKQSSWHQLDQMPSISQDFSDFQMNRLLKRRAVQVSLEEAGKEMGARDVSMEELQGLLGDGFDGGVVQAGRIAQDDVTKYMLVHKAKKPTATEVKKEEPKSLIDASKGFDISEHYDDVQWSSDSDIEEIAGDTGAKIERRRRPGGVISEILSVLEDKVYIKQEVKDETEEIINDEQMEIVDIPKISQSPPGPTSEILAVLEERVEITREVINDDIVEAKITKDQEGESPEKGDGEVGTFPLAQNSCVEPMEIEECSENVSNLPETPVILEGDKTNIEAQELKIISKGPDLELSSSEEDESIIQGQGTTDKPTETVNVAALNNIDTKMATSPEQNETVSVVTDLTHESAKDLAALNYIDTKMATPLEQTETVSVVTDLTHQSAKDLASSQEILRTLEEPKVNNGAPSWETSHTVPSSQVHYMQEQPPVLDETVDNAIDDTALREGQTEKVSEDGKEEDSESDEDFIPVEDSPPRYPSPPNKDASKSSEGEGENIPEPVVPVEAMTEAELKALPGELSAERNRLMSEQGKQDRMAQGVTDQMTADAQELLKLFGVPYLVAPMEAEAQCAALDLIGLTEGTITDDSDIWLFGGRTVYKNFFNQKKQVLEYRGEDIRQYFKLNREDMIRLALLVGSDYTTGLTGIGPVTALEVLASFPSPSAPDQILSGLTKFRDWVSSGFVVGPTRVALRKKLKNTTLIPGFPSETVADAYLHPEVDGSDERFSWAKPNVVLLQKYTKLKFGWSTEKCNELIMPVMKKLMETTDQTTLDKYFRAAPRSNLCVETLSKRVLTAVKRLNRDPDDPDDPEEPIASTSGPTRPKKPKTEPKAKGSADPPDTEVKKPRLKKEMDPLTHRLHLDVKIPQRELDNQQKEERKKQAAEILRANRGGRGRSRGKALPKAKAPLPQAKLSESSSSGEGE